MRDEKHKRVWIIAIPVILMICFVLYMLVEIRSMQGNSRVVNYAGIVRGATQRLVKRELYGIEDDGEIERLTGILEELRTGEGPNRLNVLRDEAYHEKLDQLTVQWAALKNAIFDARGNADHKGRVFALSESYFIAADETVDMAERYTDGIAKRVRVLEIVITACVALVVALFAYLLISDIRQTRRLKDIAYIDFNTGLPNKRSCEERLNEGGIVPADTVTCCMMFDLNNLKKVNDAMGHKAGDLLIASFASALRRAAPGHMFIGRFGGDEFVGILHDTSREEIEAFLRQLTRDVSAMNDMKNSNGIRISFACGYALSSEHPNCTVKVLMDLADKEMYVNKATIKAQGGR